MLDPGWKFSTYSSVMMPFRLGLDTRIAGVRSCLCAWVPSMIGKVLLWYCQLTGPISCKSVPKFKNRCFKIIEYSLNSFF